MQKKVTLNELAAQHNILIWLHLSGHISRFWLLRWYWQCNDVFFWLSKTPLPHNYWDGHWSCLAAEQSWAIQWEIVSERLFGSSAQLQILVSFNHLCGRTTKVYSSVLAATSLRIYFIYFIYLFNHSFTFPQGFYDPSGLRWLVLPLFLSTCAWLAGWWFKTQVLLDKVSSHHLLSSWQPSNLKACPWK